MTSMNNIPTKGQLERRLSQTMLSLYRDRFGQLPSKVSCQIFDNKVAIVAESVVTSTERLLIDHSRCDLVKDVRSIVNSVFIPVVKEQIDQILQQKVVSIMSDYCLEYDYVGIIAILESPPQVRSSRKQRQAGLATHN